MATRSFKLAEMRSTSQSFRASYNSSNYMFTQYSARGQHQFSQSDDLDVSLVEELSPPTSPQFNTCFDQDALLINTCVKRPRLERSSASTQLSTQIKPSVFTSATVSNQTTENEVPLTPIHSARLRPIRQKTKNVMLTITEDSCVLLEFIKNMNGYDMVLEVMKIPVDGEHVQVFHPNGGQGYQLGNCPANLASSTFVKEYYYKDLPAKYLKRYQYASRFVRLVQSKTTKITMYTEEAKCMLMENSPEADFEAMFYEGGKVCLSKGGVRITRKDGTTTLLPPSGQSEKLPEPDHHLLNYTNQCHKKCLQLESILESLQSNQSSSPSESFSPFPVTVGRRPTRLASTKKCNSMWNESLMSMSDISEIKPSKRPLSPSSPPSTCGAPWTQPSSLQSQFSARSEASSGSGRSSSRSAPPAIVCRVHVPQVGWGIQLSNGVVLVQFNDGTEMTIQSSPMVITFKDTDNTCSRYGESDSLPAYVCKKLETLPTVMSHLQTACTAQTNSGNQH